MLYCLFFYSCPVVFSAVETLTKYTGRGVGRKGFIAFHLPITETNSEIFKTAFQCLP